MEEKSTGETATCKCPYCDAEAKVIADTCAVCEPCSINIIVCRSCGGAAREGAEKCSECGEPLRG